MAEGGGGNEVRRQHKKTHPTLSKMLGT